jgi:hypothetical protein
VLLSGLQPGTPVMGESVIDLGGGVDVSARLFFFSAGSNLFTTGVIVDSNLSDTSNVYRIITEI